MSDIDIQAYRDTHHLLVEAVAGLSEEELTWKESPVKWSVTEVLAHLADHSIAVSFRIRDILADTTAQLPAFNQDKWVAGQRANESSVTDALHVFQALLVYNSLLFGRLSEAELNKSGINFKGETVRVRDIIAGFTKHVHIHLAQINRIKQSYRNRLTAAGTEPA
ncbi:DinB family protein [Gorillibacterium timonense]|uniref:DinB family protein n=1 Tax=Gorillibacterium timonense TaxID=1689269 RepID=UPI00071E057D|nr:DinB family protein [Gorillibacterium timonense]